MQVAGQIGGVRGARSRQALCAMGGTIGLLHLFGWGLVACIAARTASPALSFGVAVTAYTLGMRHAFDADHIAAIDNTTRKLREEGETPLSVGFWFSLGHSTIVFGLALSVLVAAHRLLFITDPSSVVHSIGGLLGTLVSALFLYAIAAWNLQGLLRTLRAAHRAEERPAAGGPFFALFRRLLGGIRRPEGMYPVGILFGLGFDTATEVLLLAATASAAIGPLPWYGVLALPCLFAAGMSLCDTADGVCMQYAYDWSLLQPGRRLLWNACVTGLSVAVALAVGTLELLGLLSGASPPAARLLLPLTRIDLGASGLAIAGILVGSWLAAVLLWPARGRERRALGPRDAGRRDATGQRQGLHGREEEEGAACGCGSRQGTWPAPDVARERAPGGERGGSP